MSAIYRHTALLLVLATLFALLCPIPVAYAADGTEWVRVCEEGVFLYANNYSQKVLCILQKSYYLRIVKREDSMLLVSIMGDNADFPSITGYVWATQVKEVKSAPATPYYPTVYVTVSGDSAAVKLSPVPSADTLVVAANTQKLSFYGEIISYGETWYYVCFADKFGYVRSTSVTTPVIAAHPTPVEDPVPVVNPTPDDPTNEPDQPATDTTSLGAEIVLIVFVVLLALGLALAVILPGNIKKRNDVFDGNI